MEPGIAARRYVLAELQEIGAGSLISERYPSRHELSPSSRCAESWRAGGRTMALRSRLSSCSNLQLGSSWHEDLLRAARRDPIAAIENVCLQWCSSAPSSSWATRAGGPSQHERSGRRRCSSAPLLRRRACSVTILEPTLVHRKGRAQHSHNKRETRQMTQRRCRS